MKYIIGIIALASFGLIATFVVKYQFPASQDAYRILPAGVVGKKVIDLSNTNLSKTPSYVFTSTAAVELDLSHNQLEGALQSEVGNLKNLRVLDLSDNQFTGVPAEVGKLYNLEVLDLSNNKLTGLPYEIGNLSKLKLLDVSGNDFAQADMDVIREHLPASTVIKTHRE